MTPGRDLRRSLIAREQANDALARGDAASAKLGLETALGLNPFDDDSALLASMLHLDDGDLARAVALAVEAIRIRPFHPAALNLLGVACGESGRSDLAQRFLQHAVRLAPGFPAARRNLADAKRKTGGKAVPAVAAGGDREIWKSLREILEPREPCLSLCVLVGTGQEVQLQATLDSVGGAASDVVLLGVGTHPERALAARDGGPRIYEVPATGDWGAARTEALQICRGDWVLLLDAGECLHGDTAILAAAQADERVLGATFPVRLPDGTGRHQLRLVRNAPGLRFVGRMRADLRGSVLAAMDRWGLTLATVPAEIRGGRPEAGLAPDERALERAWLADHALDYPDDWSAREARARLDLEDGNLDSAAEEIRGALALLQRSAAGRTPLFGEPLALLDGLVLARRGAFAELAARMRQHREVHPVSAGARFLEGLALKSLGQAERAVACLEEARASSGIAGFAVLPEAFRDGGLLNLLGAAQLDAGRPPDAEATLREAVRRNPLDLQAQIGLAGVLLATGRSLDFLQALDGIAASHGDSPEAWVVAGRILACDPSLAEVSLAWFGEAARRHPGHPGVQRGYGEARARAGRGTA